MNTVIVISYVFHIFVTNFLKSIAVSKVTYFFVILIHSSPLGFPAVHRMPVPCCTNSAEVARLVGLCHSCAHWSLQSSVCISCNRDEASIFRVFRVHSFPFSVKCDCRGFYVESLQCHTAVLCPFIRKGTSAFIFILVTGNLAFDHTIIVRHLVFTFCLLFWAII